MNYNCSNIAVPIETDCNGEKLLTTDYLKKLHPFLTDIQAEELLIFCNEHTIDLEGCYGDGSIMLPKFLKSSP